MPKLAANLSMLFPELGFLDRFAAAARAGFEYVEYQFPYAWDAQQLAGKAREAGVQVVLHNFPQGDAGKGERGIACLPGREAEFRGHTERAVDYARLAGCKRLHCPAGVVPPGADRAAAQATYVANLRGAARRLQVEGIELLIEPISQRSAPGYFVSRSAHAVELLELIGAPNARLQYDIFHMQIMEGDLANTLERLLPRIGHVQLADAPGRHEPGSGEINFDFLLRHLDAIGYLGWVGCEYNPQGDTLEGLKWAKPYLVPR